MKRQLTLGGRLTIYILVILVIVLGGLIAVFGTRATDFQNRYYSAVQTAGLSSAKEAAAQVSFEVAVGEAGEVAKKLTKYSDDLIAQGNKERDISAIFAFDKSKKLVATIGDLDFEETFPDGVGLGEDFAKPYGDYMIASSAVKAEEDSVGYILIVESMSKYLSFRRNLALTMIAAIALGLLIAVVLVILVGRNAARPMVRLSDAAQRIADGDLVNIDVEEHGVKEADQLSRSVRVMAQALRTQVVTTMKLTDEATMVSREVAQGMAHLATSAAQQAAAVAETASTVEEMEKAGKSAAQNARQIVDAAEKTTEVSIRGRQAVDTTSDLILRIKDDSLEISAKARTLLASVEEIGNIIRSVNAIAEQSKILAVNASIEAAKAGEYGSGFAVVAQEVKDLAQQSKDATQQITITLTAIRKAIEEMVQTASAGEKRTEKGVRTVSNAGANMNDLSEAIRENSEFANIINAAVNQQTLGLTQIAAAVEEINVSATENQDVSRKIEQNTRLMTESLEELAELVGRWNVEQGS